MAIERHSKLVLNIALGKRDQLTTDTFLEGVRHATTGKHFQITADGFAPYRSAITTTLSDRCDFAQLIKVYRAPSDGEARNSPAEVALRVSLVCSLNKVVDASPERNPAGVSEEKIQKQILKLRALANI